MTTSPTVVPIEVAKARRLLRHVARLLPHLPSTERNSRLSNLCREYVADLEARHPGAVSSVAALAHLLR